MAKMPSYSELTASKKKSGSMPSYNEVMSSKSYTAQTRYNNSITHQRSLVDRTTELENKFNNWITGDRKEDITSDIDAYERALEALKRYGKDTKAASEWIAGVRADNNAVVRQNLIDDIGEAKDSRKGTAGQYLLRSLASAVAGMQGDTEGMRTAQQEAAGIVAQRKTSKQQQRDAEAALAAHREQYGNVLTAGERLEQAYKDEDEAIRSLAAIRNSNRPGSSAKSRQAEAEKKLEEAQKTIIELGGTIDASAARGAVKSYVGSAGAGVSYGLKGQDTRKQDSNIAAGIDALSTALEDAVIRGDRQEEQRLRSMVDAINQPGADKATILAEFLPGVAEVTDEVALRDRRADLQRQALGNKGYAAFKELYESGNAELEASKVGKSDAEKVLIDVAVQGGNMAADAAIGLVTGGAATPMALRTYGAGVIAAESAGASQRDAMLYGIASAGVELLSEKLFDGLAGVYGGGKADEAVDYFIGKMAKTKTGRAAWNLLFSAGGESVEELISGIADPILTSIYNDRGVFENLSETEAADVLYDMMIGGIMGFLGGSVEGLTQRQSDASKFFQVAAENGLSYKQAVQIWAETSDVNVERDVAEIMGKAESAALKAENEAKRKEASEKAEQAEYEYYEKLTHRAQANKVLDSEERMAEFQKRTGIELKGGKGDQARAVMAAAAEKVQEIDQKREQRRKDDEAAHAKAAVTELDTGDVTLNEKGETVVDGKVVDMSVQETLQQMGFSEARAEDIAKQYDPNTATKGEFAKAMRSSYLMARAAVPEGEINAFVDKATPQQRQIAAAYGEADRVNAAKAAQEAVKAKVGDTVVRGEGGIINETGRSIDLDTLDAPRKAGYQMAQALAKAVGNNVHLFESVERGGKRVLAHDVGPYKAGDDAPNGWYDHSTGDIYVDINAGERGQGTILYTLSHEYTHFVRQWSPEKFETLAKFLFENADISIEAAIQNQMDKAARAGRDIDRDKAMEEVVADAMEAMLSDTNAAEKIIELRNRDKGLWEKLKELITKIRNAVRAAYKDFAPDSHEGLMLKRMDESLTEKLSTLFAEGVADAAENYSRVSDLSVEEQGEHLTNAESFADSAVQVSYQIRPPYNDGTKAFNEFADSLNEEARYTFDLFYGFYQASRITGGATNMAGKRVKAINIAAPYVSVEEWNQKLSEDEQWAETARKLANFLPDEVRREMRMNKDGTLNPNVLETEFKMKTSLMQRLVDSLPLESIDSQYKLGDKVVDLSTGRALQSVGGEAYRRALTEATRKLYAEGKLKKVSIGTMHKDRWGSLGFLAANGKTGASGDLTTLCPQMMYNRGCFYCYRRAAMESGVNNKLVAQSVWYTGEILRIRDADVRSLNENGGLRIQSFGDWMPQFSAQLADILYDAELRGLQVKIITKEPSMIQYIAKLREQGIGKNLYFNLSADYAIEKGPAASNSDGKTLNAVNPARPFMRDAQGTFWWKRAMTVEEAAKFRAKYPWVNTRIVATDITEFIRGLKDPTVDVVTGYHGNLQTKGWERIDSTTGEAKVQIEAIGDAGMPRFVLNKETMKWETEYAGKTNAHKRLAASIEQEGLQAEYYTKTCCITGRCATCNGKCGKMSRSFEVKNATNRDAESVAYWQEHMTSAEETENDRYSFSGRDEPTADADIRYSMRYSKADNDYFDAVGRGDTETAQKMLDDAAKAAGYTIKAYHGTRSDEFFIFDKNRIGDNYGGYNAAGGAFDFSTDKGWAARWGMKASGNGNVRTIPVYLKAEKTFYSYQDVPKDLESTLPKGLTKEEKEKAMAGGYAYKDVLEKHGIDFKKTIMSKGYDSYSQYPGHENIAVYNPEQIKSAELLTADPETGEIIPLSERFNPDNPDIRYSLRNQPTTDRYVLTNAEGINDTETRILARYREEYGVLVGLEETLVSQREALKAVQSTKDRDAIRMQREEIMATENRINIQQGILSRMEDSATLQRVLKREREIDILEGYERGRFDQGYETAPQIRKEMTAKANEEFLKGYERGRFDQGIKMAEEQRKAMEYAEKKTGDRISRLEARLAEAEAEERRRVQQLKDYRQNASRKELLRKIGKTTKELNDWLAHPTKDKHIPSKLIGVVVEALDAVNMDTVNADERLAIIDRRIAEVDKALSVTTEYANRKRLEDERAKLVRQQNTISKQGYRMQENLSKLQSVYNEIRNSDDPVLAGAYDEDISAKIQEVWEYVGDTTLRDMRVDQLQMVYKLYRMVSQNVRNANKAFLAAKNATIEELATLVMNELAGKAERGAVMNIRNTIEKLVWTDLKPAYAFKTIGSETMTNLFNAVRSGEDTWAKDVSEARAFYLGEAEKHGVNGWNMDEKFSFTSTSGLDFELTLGDIMSIYAYSKREQALDHLAKGGIVLEPPTDKKGPFAKVSENATAYNLSPEILAEITGKLTTEQKAFVDAMQRYLSTDMGAKGNEVSEALYDVKLFTEENYFPLRSSSAYMARVKDQQKGEVRIKNSGFTKATTPNASNPIVMQPFMEVWSEHVSDMAMYHAFTLPLEDFYRVYNFKTAADETSEIESVNKRIQNVYGKAAIDYIDTLLRDINGGARGDKSFTAAARAFSKFKKASVMASASVVVQQPSAIARAFNYIPVTYFIGPKVNADTHDRVWDELKKYAPIAVIKEIGSFDQNAGKRTVDWIGQKQYGTFMEKVGAFFTDNGFRDDAFGYLAGKADEITWCAIWEASKRMAQDTTKLQGEALLQKAGEIFTETVVNTQVYDSVMSRSQLMRSKDGMAQMLTAFMGEPTTTLNMLYDAVLQGKRGDYGYAAKTIGSVTASIALNAALVSFVKAARDDDEDESYWEKYMAAMFSAFRDGIDVRQMIPYVRDLVSLGKGFDVERTDVSVYSDVMAAWNKLMNAREEDEATAKEYIDLLANFGNLLGIPATNLIRDGRAVRNVIAGMDEKSTAAGIRDAIREGWTGERKSDGQQLYEALMAGDTKQIERVTGRYETQKEADADVRKYLREADSRIAEAALARFEGRTAEYDRIINEIINEGKLDRNVVVGAVRAEEERLDEDSVPLDTKISSLYAQSDLVEAISDGEYGLALRIKDDIVSTTVANGKTKAEAERQFKTNAQDAAKTAYMDGKIQKSTATSLLKNYSGKSGEDAKDIISAWDFEKKNGWIYSQRGTEFKDGNITRSQLKTAMTTYGGMKSDEAELAIKVYEWEMDGITNASDAMIRDYTKEGVEAAGISREVWAKAWYIKYNTKGEDADGDGKTDTNSALKNCMPLINELPISAEEKTFIATRFWSKANVNKYKTW